LKNIKRVSSFLSEKENYQTEQQTMFFAGQGYSSNHLGLLMESEGKARAAKKLSQAQPPQRSLHVNTLSLSRSRSKSNRSSNGSDKDNNANANDNHNAHNNDANPFKQGSVTCRSSSLQRQPDCSDGNGRQRSGTSPIAIPAVDSENNWHKSNKDSGCFCASPSSSMSDDHSQPPQPPLQSQSQSPSDLILASAVFFGSKNMNHKQATATLAATTSHDNSTNSTNTTTALTAINTNNNTNNICNSPARKSSLLSPTSPTSPRSILKNTNHNSNQPQPQQPPVTSSCSTSSSFYVYKKPSLSQALLVTLPTIYKTPQPPSGFHGSLEKLTAIPSKTTLSTTLSWKPKYLHLKLRKLYCYSSVESFNQKNVSINELDGICSFSVVEEKENGKVYYVFEIISSSVTSSTSSTSSSSSSSSAAAAVTPMGSSPSGSSPVVYLPRVWKLRTESHFDASLWTHHLNSCLSLSI
jgi:hypothetical protein